MSETRRVWILAGMASLGVALRGAVAATRQGDWEHSPGRPFVRKSVSARGGPWDYEARFTNEL
jgi:hypothetical protein